jgi:hypothetical protein
MSLLAPLQWYWDLSSAGASIVDQHSGLSLSKIGTTTTDSTGGPDGGPCIDFGAAAGKYRNASVAKTVSYDDGYTVNIWVRSTGTSTIANFVCVHRADPPSLPGGRYFQITARAVATQTDRANTFPDSGASRIAFDAQAAENVWQMLTLRDTGSTSELYRNGVLVSSSATVIGTRSTTAAPFVIGGDWDPTVVADASHRGQLAMAGVWNEPLSQANITRLYNGGMGRRYADLGGSGIVPILRQHYAAQGVR